MRKIKFLLIGLLLAVTTAAAVLSLLVTLFLPTTLKRLACAPYGIRCAIAQATIRPHLNLTTDLVIHHLTVFEGDGRSAVLQARRLDVTLDLHALILSRRLMPTGVTIDSPELLLRKLEDGRWNVMPLIQEVRRHLRPTPRATPAQVPWVSLNAGAFRLGDRRITDLNVRVEPRPAPLLLELQARVQVEGQPVQATAVVTDTLQGEVRVKGLEVMLSGAARPWTPRAALRYRIDPAAHTLHIPAWTLEDDGVMARGAGIIHYGDWPPIYAVTVAGWRADLSAFIAKLPSSWLSSLTGEIQGAPITIEGHWPERPAVSLTATLSDVGLQLRTQQFGLKGLKGVCRLRQTGNRLRLQADLHGEAAELMGERHANPTLGATFTADVGSGDFVAEQLHASIRGARIRAMGRGRQWGRNGLDLTTTEVIVEPAILNRLFHRAHKGLTIKTLQRPSIHARWSGRDRPWSVEIASRSVQIASPTAGYDVTLQESDMAVQGIGTSWRDLQGRLAVRQAALGDRYLSALQATFEIHPDSIQIPTFHFAAAGGRVEGQTSFSRHSPLSDARLKLSVQGLRVQQLLPALKQTLDPLGIAIGAEISGAVSGGRVSATVDLPPAVTRQVTRFVHRLDHTPDHTVDSHLTLHAQGTLQTANGVQVSGSVRVEGLRALLSLDAPEHREPPVDLAVAYRDGFFTIKVQELGFSARELTALLSRIAAGRMLARQGGVMISAEATFGGSRPPSGSGDLALRGLSLDLTRQGAATVHLLQGLTGSVAFLLGKGSVTIKETALRAAGGLNFTVKGSLPIGAANGEGRRLHVGLPWTEASPLLSSLATFAPDRLEGARAAGQIRADLEIIGQEYHGTVALRGVNMESHLVRVDGLNGTIPVIGKLGKPSVAEWESAAGKISWSRLSEGAYEAALERWRKQPVQDQASYSMTIASLRYGPIELRDFEAALAPSGNQIAIQRLGFQVWGGRINGWGTVQPMAGGAALALLTDAISLRAICDAFPPIKGYISGRFNGLADLSIPAFALDKAQGKARFWAVDSRQERKEISRALIEKLAGQRIRYFSLFGQDRRYDRGVLDVALKDGNLIFHELDISHTTLGIKDLDIKVSPTFNKIGSAHLLESIRKATERIKAKAQPNP